MFPAVNTCSGVEVYSSVTTLGRPTGSGSLQKTRAATQRARPSLGLGLWVRSSVLHRRCWWKSFTLKLRRFVALGDRHNLLHYLCPDESQVVHHQCRSRVGAGPRGAVRRGDRRASARGDARAESRPPGGGRAAPPRRLLVLRGHARTPAYGHRRPARGEGEGEGGACSHSQRPTPSRLLVSHKSELSVVCGESARTFDPRSSGYRLHHSGWGSCL